MVAWKNFEKEVRTTIEDVCKGAEISEQFNLNWIEPDDKNHQSNRPDFIVKLGDIYLVIDAKCWKRFIVPNPLDITDKQTYKQWSSKNILKTFWYSYYFEILLNHHRNFDFELYYKILYISGVADNPDKPIIAYLSGDHETAEIALNFEYEHPKEGMLPIKLSDICPVVVPVIITRNDTELSQDMEDVGKKLTDLSIIQFPRNELIVNTLEPGIAPAIPKSIFITKIGKFREVVDLITKSCPTHLNKTGTSLKELERISPKFKLPPNAGFILNFYSKKPSVLTIGKQLTTYYVRCPKCEKKISDFSRVTGWCPIYSEPLINYKCLTGPNRELCVACPSEEFNIDDEIYLCSDCDIFFDLKGKHCDWNEFIDNPSLLISV